MTAESAGRRSWLDTNRSWRAHRDRPTPYRAHRVRDLSTICLAMELVAAH